jgi:lysylphosphatidylglycerol synthetase-like protein (DUF2156 family)
MNTDVAAIIAVAALVLVAAALIGAGLYALFGKPTSHGGKERKQHVIHGFQLGGGIVLGIILMGSLVGCSQIAFGIVESGTLSRTSALSLATASLLVILSMIRHWAKHFAGWVGYSVLNGLQMVKTGHILNNPSILVPRWWSISATVLMFTSALVSVRFAKDYTLNAVDKAALMTWLLAFTFSLDVESTHAFYHEPFSLIAILVGTLALVVALLYYRTTYPHRGSRTHLRRSVRRSQYPSGAGGKGRNHPGPDFRL